MKCSEVAPGKVFRYASSKLVGQTPFIKLFWQGGNDPNVVNTTTWVAAYVHPDTEVVVVGDLIRVARLLAE